MLHRLPPEIQGITVRYLPRSSAARWLQTCSALAYCDVIVAAIFRDLRDMNNLPPFAVLAKYGSFIKCFNLNLKDMALKKELFKPASRKWTAKLTNVVNLLVRIPSSAHCAAMPETVLFLRRFIQSLPNPLNVASLVCLAYPRVGECEGMPAGFLEPLLRLSNIRDGCFPWISMDQLALINNFTKLRRLHISETSHIFDPPSNLTLESLTMVEEIRVEYFGIDESLRLISSLPRNLKRVLISVYSSEHDDDLGLFEERLKELLPFAHIRTHSSMYPSYWCLYDPFDLVWGADGKHCRK
ncbi:hypothetical protein HDU97_007556 [Phlyctochytrium planicorne]|nr:hypothetical protein HDU97_007556 [Phlyctochytrium planicorne]